MATCVKSQTIYAFATASTTTKTAYPLYTIDSVTPLASCGQMLISSVEYQDLQHGYITKKEDAESIAFAVIMAFSVVFAVKLVIKALNTAENYSDEKH